MEEGFGPTNDPVKVPLKLYNSVPELEEKGVVSLHHNFEGATHLHGGSSCWVYRDYIVYLTPKPLLEPHLTPPRGSYHHPTLNTITMTRSNLIVFRGYTILYGYGFLQVHRLSSLRDT